MNNKYSQEADYNVSLSALHHSIIMAVSKLIHFDQTIREFENLMSKY